jgi:hypothetical protein
MTVDRRVYFLPGRQERVSDGLGSAIVRAGFSICGHEIVNDFARLRFAEQLSLIRSDLQTTFWKPDARIIARSYGAYLLLNTLAEMSPFPGRILLLSPVLGAAVANNGFYVSRPPRADRFANVVESGEFPGPRYLEIHTGSEDNGCDPQLADRFAALVSDTRLHIVAGAGHDLGDEYTRSALREFLSESVAP